MSDIIEAAARALQDSLGNTLLPILNRHIASIVLTAVTPLIRTVALEEAAKVADGYRNWLGESTVHGDRIASRIRALAKPTQEEEEQLPPNKVGGDRRHMDSGVSGEQAPTEGGDIAASIRTLKEQP